MHLARDYRCLPEALRGGVVSIGNFDGVHRGHEALLQAANQLALAYGVPHMVLTFEPHPRQFFARRSGATNLSSTRLLPFHLKLRMLAERGVQGVLAQRFDAAFSSMPADAFISQVLVGALRARAVVTGQDFVFGHQRGGDANLLQAMAVGEHGFFYQPVAELAQGAGKISSQTVRLAVAAGEMAQAAQLLGRPYAWLGRVIHGQQRGRTIGFPTANIAPPPVLLPARGVYAVRCQSLCAGMPHGEWMEGVANWGVRPTVGGSKAPRLEVHLFDRTIDLYGQRLYVEWISRIRDEKTFDSMEALRQQIEQDCQQARAAFMGCSHA